MSLKTKTVLDTIITNLSSKTLKFFNETMSLYFKLQIGQTLTIEDVENLKNLKKEIDVAMENLP